MVCDRRAQIDLDANAVVAAGGGDDAVIRDEPAGAQVDRLGVGGAGGINAGIVDDGAGRTIDRHTPVGALDQPDRILADAVGNRPAAAEGYSGEADTLDGPE